MNAETKLIHIALRKAALKDYLSGLKRTAPQAFKQITEGDDPWRAHAATLLNQRNMHFLEVLPNDLLALIADGSISVRRTAEEMSNEPS